MLKNNSKTGYMHTQGGQLIMGQRAGARISEIIVKNKKLNNKDI